MIYAITGYSRVGKDTLASLFPKYKRLAFADALKEECQYVLKKHLNADLDFFDEDVKVRHRNFLVEWGEIARSVDPYHWIRKTRLADNTIITDLRYKNEAEYIKSKGGRIIYLSRPGYFAANDIELQSIQEIIDEDLIDYCIANNGTIEDLKNRTTFIKAI